MPRITYRVAGAPIVSLNVNVEDGEDNVAVVSNDMIDQLRLLTIDFVTMTIEAVVKP